MSTCRGRVQLYSVLAVKVRKFGKIVQQALVMPDRKQDGAAWVIRTRLHNVSCAINALTGFATASLKEDRYGILQLTDPSLGTILQAILSLQLVLERHLRSTASTGSRRYASSSGKGMI